MHDIFTKPFQKLSFKKKIINATSLCVTWKKYCSNPSGSQNT